MSTKQDLTSQLLSLTQFSSRQVRQIKLNRVMTSSRGSGRGVFADADQAGSGPVGHSDALNRKALGTGVEGTR